MTDTRFPPPDQNPVPPDDERPDFVSELHDAGPEPGTDDPSVVAFDQANDPIPEDMSEKPVAGGPDEAIWRGPGLRPQWVVPGMRGIRRIDVVFCGLLVAVLAVAAWLRFDAQNWDDFTHLHPDERFLTDVVTQLNGPLRFTDDTGVAREEHRLRCEQRIPAEYETRVIDGEETQVLVKEAGRGGYLDAECSPLNPNNLDKGLYVYGEFPLFTVHAAGVARSQLSRDYHTFLEAFDPDAAADHTITTYWETYTGAQLIGRSISATADWLTVIVLFLIGRRLYGRWTALLAAAFYGLAAFPIQQSHFWTVDAFTTFWATLALYFAIRAMDGVSARQGPLAPAYLAVWIGAVAWEVGYDELPILGLVVLGVIFLVTAGLISAVRFVLGPDRRLWGDALLAASGMMAALIYLVAWSVAIVAAPNAFPISDALLSVGFSALVFGMATFVVFVAAGVVRRQTLGLMSPAPNQLAIGTVVIVCVGLIGGVAVGGLSPWAALLVALGATALLIFDATELTDYALFGLAVGGAVASRINVAPLAGMIVVAAAIRALPALDSRLDRVQRNRLVAYAMTGIVAAALMSFVAFRLLQPHAFLGPGLLGLKFNPGWREDMSEAAYLTSGDWDAPPNHQWANRTPYFFPWRNIVLWGLGLPLGFVAWAAWAWVGVAILRGRPGWTRHVIPFVWILLMFGWLGGRWVTTMRYFLPIYPMLALLGAWALLAVLGEARKFAARRRAERRALGARSPARAGRAVTMSRLAFGGAVIALIGVLGYTAAYGLGMHNIHRHQLTRVAAGRWFQEFVPGDFGLWVEGDDGTRQLVNIGRTYVGSAPSVVHLETGEVYEIAFNLESEARLEQISLNRVGDPLADPDDEVLRVRLLRDDPALGRQLLFEKDLRADFAATDAVYGGRYLLTPDPEDEILLPTLTGPNPEMARFLLEVTVTAGGPVMFFHDVVDGGEMVLYDISLRLTRTLGSVPDVVELNFEPQPLLTGHGDDIPLAPTHWTVGGSDRIPFDIPIDGEIRTIEIPHLGDPLKDAGIETMRLRLVGPDGTETSVVISADFNEGADPLGLPQTVTLDPPLRVKRLDASGYLQMATLIVEAQDPIYTSGPVIAWEGSWDDPVPWPTCPLPDDMVYRDDLPSGLSTYNCAALGMYGGHYQGIQLWMIAEDNDQKVRAMTNALDQADYLVITSNRFYDSLSRVPMRWPMTQAYYDALFDGRMGFELVRTFESPPQVGPFTFVDQILPFDDLPDVWNEHWEAEEAFHVYDHPAVMVFRKTDAYSPENTRAVLDSVSIRPVASVIGGYYTDPEPLGVVPWGAKQASEAPTMLELTDEQWDIQRDGGTWSELFDLDSVLNRNQAVAVVVWWLLMVLAGWLTWPLLYAMFPMLPDRAFPAAKITAWLIVGWLAWIGGMAHLLTWTRAGIAVLLLALSVASLLVGWRRRAEMWAYVRANQRHLWAMEGLTLALFLFFLGVRQGNPDLWHGSFGGEKPMDFAYFNAVLRSTIFPPLDPWYAGGYINYYYFGYVIVGAPVKLLGIQPSVAYNLIIPTLYAMTGVGVFSIAYNWVRSRYVPVGSVTEATRGPGLLDADDDDDDQLAWGALAGGSGQKRLPLRLPAGSPWLAGTLALLLAVVLGNLGTVRVFVTNVAKLDGYERPALYDQVRAREIEPRRTAIYDDFYSDEVADFRDDHGRLPETTEEILEVTRRAQERTDAYIRDYAQHPPLFKLWEYEFSNLRRLVGSFLAGLDDVMRGVPLPMATHRWYWAPTRIISELPGGAGHNAINEHPYFTFLYGDLHAHMIAFPITLLVLLWLVAEIIGAGQGLRTEWEAGLALGLGALAVGVLRPTNSWDWITYLLLGGAGLTYVAWIDAVKTHHGLPPSSSAERLWAWLRPGRVRALWPVAFVVPAALFARIAYYLVQRIQAEQQADRPLHPGEELIDPSLTFSSALLWVVAGLALTVAIYVALLIVLHARVNKRIVLSWLGRIFVFVVGSFIAALPFTAYFATGYTSVKPWENATTPLWAYVTIHGIFIFIVVSFLLWQTARQLRSITVRMMEGMAVPAVVIGGGAAIVVLGAVYYGVREAPVAELVVPLVVWAVILFFLPRQHPLLRAIFALIVLALAISLGVELVVLDGDIGRQNTVFKFYLQVWFLLSIVCGIGLAWMLRSAYRWRLSVRTLWQAILALLFTIGFSYPVLATQARFLDRFDKEATPLTLDGMDYMKVAVHGESGVYFRLEGDYNLIRWLQENVTGTPVVMEAHLYPSEYHWGSRISIYTGLPTILGWSFHQRQQHSLPDMDKLVQTRENNVAAFYQLAGTEGIRAAMRLIDTYEIEYVVVGVLERAFYDDIQPDPVTNIQSAGHSPGLAKFDEMVDLGLLTVEYAHDYCLDLAAASLEECPAESVYTDKIYRVVPGAELPRETAAGP